MGDRSYAHGYGSDDYQEGDPVKHARTGATGRVANSTPERTHGGWEWDIDLDAGGYAHWHSAIIRPNW